MSNGQNTSAFGLTPGELWAVRATAVLALAFIVAAFFSYEKSPLVLAISLGCLGGLMHELAQSGGKILFFARRDDGLYLGGVAGMMLGGVTGLIAAHAVQAQNPVEYQNLAYEAFMAGVGMKGLVEAATGSAVAPGSGRTLNPLPALPAAPSTVPAPSF